MPNRKNQNPLGDLKQKEEKDLQLVEILKDIKKEMNENSEKITSRLDVVEKFLYKEIEELKSQMLTLKEENKNLKTTCLKLENENKKLSENLNEVKIEIQEMQQYSRNRNIEVVGVPLTENENVYAVTEKLANTINIQYDRKEISTAHRLPSRNGHHPNIVIQFVSRSTRSEWLQAAKGKNLDAKNLSAHLPTSKIYVNEHLTPFYKSLLGRARKLKKEHLVDFVWCKDGKVFVRRQDGEKAFLIKNLEDLERFENN